MVAYQLPPTRFKLSRPAGTPQAANFSKALFEFNPDFIVLAQGNHHPDAPMAQELKDAISYVTGPGGVYNGRPTPAAVATAMAHWERRFTGAPAWMENTFMLRQQGRFCLKEGFFTIKEIQQGHDSDVVLMPNLRWRVVDEFAQDASRNVIDYDNTNPDILNAIKEAVERAGGPEKIGMLYLCSPNNPTGRRFTKEEYEGIRGLCDEINRARVSAGKPRMAVFFDDPYFEAHEIDHFDTRLSLQGQPYLKTGYEGFFKNDRPNEEPTTPAFIFHSHSKFLEQAESGMTSVVCTSPSFTKVYTRKLTCGGGLGYSPDFMNTILRVFSDQKDMALLNRCREAADLFHKNYMILKNTPGVKLIDGQCNMVMTQAIQRADYYGCEVAYPNGEHIMLKDSADVVETIGNFGGVGLVPERDDRQIPAYGYDSQNEDLIRYALNDPNRFGEGVARSVDILEKIKYCTHHNLVFNAQTILSPTLSNASPKILQFSHAAANGAAMTPPPIRRTQASSGGHAAEATPVVK